MGKSTVIRGSEKSVRKRKGTTKTEGRTFLDTKEGVRGKGGSDGVEKRGSDISVKERAGLTWDRERERDRVLQSRCLSERTEKVVSVGLARVARGEGRNKESRREKEQTGESRARGGETRNSMLGPDGSERDGISQPEECLSRQRRSSETGLVQSSQISPWEGDFLLAVRVLSVGLTPSRSFGSLFLPVISLFPTPPPHPSPRPPPRSIVSPRACSSSPSRIDVYPRGESVRVRKKER